MTQHEQIALVDISYTFRRYWHTQAESAERNDAALRTIQFLETAENASGHVIVCKDSPPYKRSEYFPQYKGQRAKASEELCAARRDLMERVRLGGWRCAAVPGAEADDIIATLCDELIEMDLAGQVWIMGCDKDLYQCLGDRVSMAIPSGSQVVHMTPQSVFDKWGVHPAQVPEFLGLVGDKADNIPGCPQVGEKTAARILSEYGGISNALAVALKQPEEFASAMKSAVLGPRLLENKDNVLLSWRLASLERKVFDELNDPPRIDTLLQPRQPVPLRADVPVPADESEEERYEDGEQSRAVEEQTREVGSCGREGVVVAPDYGGGAIVQQTEIVQQRPAAAWDLGLEPRGHKELVWMCERLQESGLYPKLRWQGIYAIALKGRSLGMSIMNALDSINIIQGKPAMGWQAIVAFAQQHPGCEYFFQVSCDPKQATWETKRAQNPRPQQRQYTIQDAKVAGLVRRGTPWETHPADMLSKTAAVKLARSVYYDSRAQGLYCAEEMGA